MTNIEAIQKILANLQKKYMSLVEIEGYTNQLVDAMKQDDAAVFGMTLDMRFKVMKKIDLLDAENMKLTNQLPETDKQKIKSILKPRGVVSITIENALYGDVFETQKRILNLLKKITAVNDEINAKVINKKQKNQIFQKNK